MNKTLTILATGVAAVAAGEVININASADTTPQNITQTDNSQALLDQAKAKLAESQATEAKAADAYKAKVQEADALNTQVNNLQAQVDQLTTQINQAPESKTALEAEIANVKSQLATAQADLQTAQSDVTTAQAQQVTAQQAVTDAQASVNQAQTAVDNAKAKAQQAEAAAAQAQAELEAKQQAEANAQTEAKQADQAVQSAQADQTKAQEQLNTVNNTTPADETPAKQAVDTAKSDEANAQTTVSQAESKVSQAEAQPSQADEKAKLESEKAAAEKREAVQASFLRQLNQHRADNGLPALEWNQNLADLATSRSMISQVTADEHGQVIGEGTSNLSPNSAKEAHAQYFPAIATALANDGSVLRTVGENELQTHISPDDSVDAIAKQILDQWIASKGHEVQQLTTTENLVGFGFIARPVTFTDQTLNVIAYTEFASAQPEKKESKQAALDANAAWFKLNEKSMGKLSDYQEPAKVPSSQDIQTSIDALNAQTQGRDTAIAQAKQELSDAQATLSQKTMARQAAESALQAIQDTIANQSKAKSDAEAKVNETRAKLNDAKQSLADKTKAVADAQAAVVAAQNKLSEATDNVKASAIDPTLLDNLTKAQADLASKQSTLTDAESHLKQLTDKQENLKATIAQKQSELSEAEANLAKADDIASLKASLTDLKVKLTNATNAYELANQSTQPLYDAWTNAQHSLAQASKAVMAAQAQFNAANSNQSANSGAQATGSNQSANSGAQAAGSNQSANSGAQAADSNQSANSGSQATGSNQSANSGAQANNNNEVLPISNKVNIVLPTSKTTNSGLPDTAQKADNRGSLAGLIGLSLTGLLVTKSYRRKH